MEKRKFPPNLRWLISPPEFEEEEKRYQVSTLFFLLSVLLTAALVLSFVAWRRDLVEAVNGLMAGIVILLVSLWLTLRGNLAIPSYLIPLGLLGVNTYIVYNGQGIHDITVLGFGMMIALGGLLLGKRGAILMSILAILCLAIIYTGEVLGLLPQAGMFREWTSFDDFIIMGILLGVTAMLIYFAMNRLSRSLVRARQSEQELRKLNEDLEQRVAERTSELQTANKHLSTLSKVKDDFVTNVSHELRTPLTSLMLQHSILEKNPQSASTYIVHLKRETERLAHLIEDLLTLSRLDQDRTEIHLTPVDLNRLAQEYISDRIPLANSRQLHLIFHPQNEIPIIQADEKMIGQVMSILLTNAFNYSPGGGEITVATISRMSEGRVWAGFTVQDTGLGIAVAERERLFERFFRGQAARAASTAGTGLGLAIAKEITDRHNGLIEVESEGVPGKGSRFTIWLPGSNSA